MWWRGRLAASPTKALPNLSFAPKLSSLLYEANFAISALGFKDDGYLELAFLYSSGRRCGYDFSNATEQCPKQVMDIFV